MKHTITFIFAAILFSLSALAQPKEIKVTVDGMDIELVRIEPGTVTLPERTAYTLGKDPQTGKWVYSYKDPMTGLYQVVSESLTLPESTQIISEAYYIMKYPISSYPGTVGPGEKGEDGDDAYNDVILHR